MRHGQARGASLALLAQQREAMQLLIDVEVRRRLVEQQQLRRLREAGGEQHALALAAAQRLHQAIAQVPAVRPPHRPLDGARDPRRTRTTDRCADTGPSARARRRETADRAAQPAAGARPAARARADPVARGPIVEPHHAASGPPRDRRRCRAACSCRRRCVPSPRRLRRAPTSSDTLDSTARPPTCHATFSIRSRTLIAPFALAAAPRPIRRRRRRAVPGRRGHRSSRHEPDGVLTARQRWVGAPQALVDRLAQPPLGLGLAHVDGVDDHVGIEAQDGLHRDSRILRLSLNGEHVPAARDLDQVVDVRPRSDSDEVGQRARTAGR